MHQIRPRPRVTHTPRLLLCSLIVLGFAVQAGASTIANSITEFSSVQGRDHWFYGFYAQGAVGGLPHGYSTGAFVPFDTFAGARWEASDAQVGANNNDFLSVNDIGGHPNGLDLGQTNLIWAIRRYQSEVDALVDVAFDLRKINVTEPRGGGVTGRIFIDGVEVATRFIANDDAIGVRELLTYHLALGSVLDFAIDPTGNPPAGQSPFSARADGSQFSVVISDHTVPEPSTMAMVGTGGLALWATVFSRRRRRRSK